MRLLHLWLVFISSTFSVIYLIFDKPEGVICGEYWPECMPAYSVHYLTFEHIGLILLSVVLLLTAKDYRWFFQLFLFVQLCDFGFFILYYKSPWIFGVPWNALKNIILGVPLAYVSIFRNGSSD